MSLVEVPAIGLEVGVACGSLGLPGMAAVRIGFVVVVLEVPGFDGSPTSEGLTSSACNLINQS